MSLGATQTPPIAPGFRLVELPPGAQDAMDQLIQGRVRVSPGTAIAAPDQPARVLGLFEGWAVRLLDLGPRFGRQVTEVLLPGDLLSLDSVLHGTPVRRVETVTAATVVRYGPLDAAALRVGSQELAEALLALLARRLARAEAMLANLGRRDAVERTGWLLLDIVTRLEARGLSQGGWCPFPLRRHHLADALGLSPTHVTRTTQELATRNLARLGDGFLTLLDRDGLDALSGYGNVPDRD